MCWFVNGGLSLPKGGRNTNQDIEEERKRRDTNVSTRGVEKGTSRVYNTWGVYEVHFQQLWSKNSIYGSRCHEWIMEKGALEHFGEFGGAKGIL